MTNDQYNALRQPLLDALARIRASADAEATPIRAELVRLQERFYGPAQAYRGDVLGLDFASLELRTSAWLQRPAEFAADIAAATRETANGQKAVKGDREQARNPDFPLLYGSNPRYSRDRELHHNAGQDREAHEMAVDRIFVKAGCKCQKCIATRAPDVEPTTDRLSDIG